MSTVTSPVPWSVGWLRGTPWEPHCSTDPSARPGCHASQEPQRVRPHHCCVSSADGPSPWHLARDEEEKVPFSLRQPICLRECRPASPHLCTGSRPAQCESGDGQGVVALPSPSWGPSGGHTTSLDSVSHLGNGDELCLLPHRATKAQTERRIPEAEAQYEGPSRHGWWLGDPAVGGNSDRLSPHGGSRFRQPLLPRTRKSRSLGENQARA